WTSDDFTGLTAVVYIDGNSLGKRVKECTRVHSFDEGVSRLRTFSKEINQCFISDPEEALRTFLDSSDEKPSFRKILGAGDEITFICDAEVALKLVLKYFDTLEKSNSGRKEDARNHSCAGIAVAHAKTPFNMVYELAEAACESAKALSRSKDGNYLDFYYCHMGVTNDFETYRKREQYMTGKPYSTDDMSAIINAVVPKLLVAGRANVKALGEAAQKSKTKYLLEVQRINAYIVDKCASFVKNPDKNENEKLFGLVGFDLTSFDLRNQKKAEEAARELAKILCFASEDEPGFYEEMQHVYDLSEFFDLWFSTTEQFADLTGVTK
ncbi:MAG: Cas10/Cmr2 second palm domain-containing protein, partial [Acutalibacteraceae bacterium]